MAPTAPAVGNDYDTIMAATVVAGAPTPQPVAPTPAPSREDEGDWTDGPAGFCDGDKAELGETASREECIGACDEAGYEAMTWDTIGGACYCFMEESCDGTCIDESGVDDCWCGETDDGFDPEAMSESECAVAGCHYFGSPHHWCECGEKKNCASVGGEWQCEFFGPMAFKGFPPPEMCGGYDDCTPGYGAIECRDDGRLWAAYDCASCDDCATTHDLTAETGGRVTCDPTTDTYYIDEDLDGNVDHEAPFQPHCSYDDCGGEECDIKTSGDRSSSPSGTTNHGAGNGWCYSDRDEDIGCAASPADCWERCSDGYGDDLVAIDWWDDGDCYCQNDCQCMLGVGDDEGYLITRDSRVGALPHECGTDEDEDEDSPSFLVTGDLTFEGMTYEAARDNTDVFVAAVADLCGVAASAVTVEISEARRRRLAEGIVVTYTVGVATANEAQAVTSAISSSSTADVDAAISKAATDAGVDEDFDGVTTTNVGTPTTTASGDDGSSGGNGGADAASAGIIGGAVAGVAVLAAIGAGAFLFMRSQGGAEPPMVEVLEMAPAPVPRKDQLYAAAVPVASAPPIMPPPPPTGGNFCSACGAPIQGSFCSQCGARA